MFDPTNPADIRMAQQYEAEIFAEACSKPRIGIGMSVQVLASFDDRPLEPVIEGRVLEIRWREEYGMHDARVLINRKEYWIFDVCLRRSRGAIRDVFVRS